MLSEINQMLPQGITSNDSVQYITSYAERWVRQALLMYEADKQIANDPNIDALVRDYRASLVKHKYEQQLVDKLLDTVVNPVEIEKYYEDHKNEFKLQSSIIKCHFVKIPSNVTNINDVEEWWKNRSEEASMNKLKDFCSKNNSFYILNNEIWTRANELQMLIPASKCTFSELTTSGTSFVRNDDKYTYFLNVKKVTRSGENAPADYVDDQIRKLIINDRKMKFLDEKIEEMYDLELNRNNIKFFTK